MKAAKFWIFNILCVLLCCSNSAFSPAQQTPAAWTQIEEIMGAKGSLQAGEVFKIVLPRTDLTVQRGRVRVAPTLGLTSWIAFKMEGQGVVAHGDLCLREAEINPVLTRLQQGGIEATALHNHLSGESPRVMFLHFWGRGEAKSLAETLRAAIELAGGIPPPPQGLQEKLDQKEIEKTLGHTGKLNAGVLQFGIPRPFPIRMHGVVLPPAMGMATAINFQPLAEGAATTGDFVVREEELAPLLKALRHHNLEVTAIHNHMLNDEPRMVFVHFWAEGDPLELARSLRAALDSLGAAAPEKSVHSRRWTFEDSAVGTPPSYITAPHGRWVVQEILDAPAGSKALVQVADSPRPYFNLAVVQGEKFRDLKLTVKMKTLAGRIDQGGGLVWRYQDADNYYVARVNPLEDNFRVYRVNCGQREMLGSADAKAQGGMWHTLSITMEGNHITCELNGQKLLDVTDEAFPNAGQVGVWTKADANTAFDNLVAESLDLPGDAAAH
jgi:hypothetical protein